MPAFIIGQDITFTLSHYADGDAAFLEARLVDLATGDPAIDWLSTGIEQTTATGDGPPYVYEATRASGALPAGLYQAQWRRPADDGGPWIDDDEITLVVAGITSDVDLFRLLLDDADGLLFTDLQVAAFLARNPSDVRLAVAEAAETLALRFAGGIKKFTTDGQSFERGSRSEGFAKLAERLRDEVAGETEGAVTTAYVTRIDGHSDDISAEDTTAYGTLDSTGRVGWRFANVHGDAPIWMPE